MIADPPNPVAPRGDIGALCQRIGATVKIVYGSLTALLVAWLLGNAWGQYQTSERVACLYEEPATRNWERLHQAGPHRDSRPQDQSGGAKKRKPPFGGFRSNCGRTSQYFSQEILSELPQPILSRRHRPMNGIGPERT